MIIYHSYQRFPSSLKSVEAFVRDLLLKNKKSGSIIATKTGSQEYIYFPEQFLNVLRKFSWKGFAFGAWFYKNLYQYFNFTCYSIRRGVLIESYLFLEKPDVTILSQHRSKSVPDYYLKPLARELKEKFHEGFIFPLT